MSDHPGRVLLVEDDVEVRRTIREMLEVLGYQVAEAPSAEEALRRCGSFRPELILVDVVLPGMNGIELTKRLKADPSTRTIPVLLCTGQLEEDVLAYGMELGADDYLLKPFRLQELAARVKAHIRAKRLFEEVARSRAELERLRLEQEHARELERLHRERSEFFAQLAHELKVVLTPLGGYVDMLLGGQLGDVSEEQREALDAMGLCLQRLRLLAEGLSELARWERGRMNLNLERLELGSLLRECVERFRLMAREGGVELRLRLPPRPLYLRADRLRLSMAVNNLIHNALRFTPTGGWIAVEGGQRGHQVEVAVSDNGVGISEEDRRAIAEGRKGGLGLAIVQAIAEAHGGQLRVQSAPGQGTRVSLFLVGDER